MVAALIAGVVPNWSLHSGELLTYTKVRGGSITGEGRAKAIGMTELRTARIRDWADTSGWRFEERPRVGWTRRLPGRNQRGVGLAVTGWLSGRLLAVAEYSYWTTATVGNVPVPKRKRYLAAVALLNRPYPRLAVLPRGPLSKVGRKLLGDDPFATGNAEFDARFRVAAAVPEDARVTLNPALVAAHAAGAIPAWSVVDHELLTYTPISGKLRDPRLIQQFAGQLVRVADLLDRN
ncbi:hypothetical protein [Nocardia heshunensis]